MRRAEWLIERPWRLGALFLLLVLPLVAVGELAASDTQRRLQQDQEAAITSLADRSADTVAARLASVLDQLVGAATTPRLRSANGIIVRPDAAGPPAVVEPPDTRELAFQLASFHAAMRSDVVYLFTVDGAGNVLGAHPPDGSPAPGTDVRSESYLRAIANRDAHYIGMSGAGARVVAVPLINPERPRAGTAALVAILKQRAIEGWLTSLGASLGDAYVVDTDARLIARLNGDVPTATPELSREPAFASAIAGRPFVGSGLDPFTNTRGPVAAAPVRDTSWSVVVTARPSALESEVVSALADQRALRVGLAAALVLGGVLVGTASSAAIRQRRETREALEQQTATAEVLQTISRSVFDLQSIFDVVVQNATKLCRGDWGYLFRRDGEVFKIVSSFGGTAELLEYERTHPTPIVRTTLIGRVVLDRDSVHIPDLFDDPAYDWPANRAAGVHTVLGVPIFKDDEVVGAIGVARNDKRPFTDAEIRLVRTFADQATIAMENVRLFNETKESLERQTALGDVLRTMASSPADRQPVLDAIARNAARFCAAEDCGVALLRADGLLEQVAQYGPISRALPPWPVDRGSVRGRAIVDRRVVHVEDMLAESEEEYPTGVRRARELGQRTILAAPLLREGVPLGAIALRRADVRPFTEKQIELLRTFADQAAIAIENVRLFNETKDSLERQTALAEILRVIADSPSDRQPVLDAVARNTTRYCDAEDAVVFLVDGNDLRRVAHHGPIPIRNDRAPLDERGVAGHAVLERRTIHVADIESTEGDRYPTSRAYAAESGRRGSLAAPLLREGTPIGVILLRKMEPSGFSQSQIRLVEAFADQAVIAIENVRLFNETRDALERQTAISEILRALAASPNDERPVLDVIARSAVRYCSADDAGVVLVRDGRGHRVAHEGPLPTLSGPTVELSRDGVVGRAVLDRRVVQVTDVLGPEGDEYPRTRTLAEETGQRAMLVAPMMREGRVIGAILLRKSDPVSFTSHQRQLVEAFADQAVIAIENVRLFNETKRALEQQTAVGEVLKTISRSAFDLEPVLDIVLNNAVRLAGADIGWLSRVENDSFTTVAYSNEFPQEVKDELVRQRAQGHISQWVPLGQGGGVMGFTLAEGRTIHVPDVREDAQLRSSVVARLSESRTVVGVPMIRDGRSIGGMVLARYEVRPFAEHEIALVQTFADQAAIAIENVRLFNETKEALERQTAVAQVLGEISQSGFDLKPVLETVIAHATKLCAADQGFIYRRDGELFRLAVSHGITPEFKAFTETHPLTGTDRGTLTGRVVQERKTVHVPDVLSDPDYTYWEAQKRGNYRALLGVPMIRDDEVIGVMLMWRTEPLPFTDEEIALVTTFASQATIAIENVRLFDETKEALERQTATADILRVIAASPTDVQPVLDAIADRAMHLCAADGMVIRLLEGDELVVVARAGTLPAVGQDPRIPLGRDTLTGAALLEARTIHIADVQAGNAYPRAREMALRGRHHTIAAVPLLREGRPIGVFSLARQEIKPYSERELALVATFADQAVIAIQNVQLFNEIQDKSRLLEVASRHKSEFLANMSHELRTPLNAIIGFSEVLLQGLFGEVNEKQREYLNDVLGSGQHLLSLINDILDLSKIEAGRLELELSTFLFRDALESGVTIVRERASRHNITLNVIVPEDLGPVEGDERKVKQILYNLLSNAVKFTPDGGRVDVSVRRDNGEVRVEVRDNGIGIAEADQARIFEEFQQVGRERSREGTGLGLTLTKRFVELHGGRIWLESAPGKGSSFAFTLPLRQAAPVRA